MTPRTVAPVNHVTRMAAVLGGALLAALVPLSVIDVALRYLFSAPVRGAFELTELAMVGVVFLGLGQAQSRKEHITIDLLYERLGRRHRAAIDRVARAVSLAVALAVAWQLALYAERMRAAHEVSGVLGAPLHVAAAVAVAGFALYALALLADA